jgi:hypothetical protein
MAQIFLVHSFYDQPYCYDGEGFTNHTITAFSTLVGAQAYQKRQSHNSDIEQITLDDNNSCFSWCDSNGK